MAFDKYDYNQLQSEEKTLIRREGDKITNIPVKFQGVGVDGSKIFASKNNPQEYFTMKMVTTTDPVTKQTVSVPEWNQHNFLEGQGNKNGFFGMGKFTLTEAGQPGADSQITDPKSQAPNRSDKSKRDDVVTPETPTTRKIPLDQIIWAQQKTHETAPQESSWRDTGQKNSVNAVNDALQNMFEQKRREGILSKAYSEGGKTPNMDTFEYQHTTTPEEKYAMGREALAQLLIAANTRNANARASVSEAEAANPAVFHPAGASGTDYAAMLEKLGLKVK